MRGFETYIVYIPHSSDKTKSVDRRKLSRADVYIPHSSDKTYMIFKLLSTAIFVYIPHSSDKTWWCNITQRQENLFTSLIVQIKPGGIQTIVHDASSFTSLIVQIKQINKCKCNSNNKWVYIPHSSDKTKFLNRVK